MSLIRYARARTLREKCALALMMVVVLSTGLYFYVAEPFYAEKERLISAIVISEKDLQWFEMAGKFLQKKGGEPKDKSPVTGKTVQDIVAQSLVLFKLNAYSPVVQQQANDTVTLTFKQIPFDEGVKWIIFLWQQHHITTAQAQITRTGVPGLVSLSLTLKKCTSTSC